MSTLVPSHPDLLDALRAMGLVGAHERPELTPLPGGVSSDIYRVDLPHDVFCAKRALARLKVAAEWRVPVERNAYEVAWMQVADKAAPGCVPRLRGHDPARGVFAMAWMPPSRYRNWKTVLASGEVDAATARAVGDTLGQIHARTADDPAIAARFATDALFKAIRLEPYLEATARCHGDLAGELQRLVETTAATRRVLVHGDYSPKNLLIGPEGRPVILDAECAWFGDPAFDLGFVLNHLILKAAWRPQWRERYLSAYAALCGGYRPHVHWEPWNGMKARTARLLPGLLLARIDGKSPVEYLDDARRDLVRSAARSWLGRSADLEQLADRVDADRAFRVA